MSFLSCENSSVPATTSWLTKPLGHLDYQLRRSYLLYCSDDMCSVTSVSSSTICGPHAILENYEECADKIVSTKIANIAVGNFGIDRASEAADAPQDKQHTEVLQLRISLGTGKSSPTHHTLDLFRRITNLLNPSPNQHVGLPVSALVLVTE